MSPTPAPRDNKATQLASIASLGETLCSEAAPLALRFRALFSLKHIARQASSSPSPSSSSTPLPPGLEGEDETHLGAADRAEAAAAAIDTIAAAFASPSALLKHELAYCLGQTENPAAAAPHLTRRLEDLREDAMCRHEAAEALGALADERSLGLLGRYRDREGEDRVVSETCEIAIDRIEWVRSEERKREKLRASDFASIDPAPPLPEPADGSATLNHHTATVEELEKALLDTSKPLFRRYRAMFALRDLASPPDLPTAVPAVHALAKGFGDGSALFRHEIAFVFGQLSHPASIPALTAALRNRDEAAMVRHEAAEALGSLGEEEGVEDTLREFLADEVDVVRDSVIVAIDMAEYERSGEAEYALIPVVQTEA